jgi:hypothetical protein
MRAATFLAALVLALAGAGLALAAEATREEFAARAEPICKASREASGRILAGVRAEVKTGKLGPAAAQFQSASKALEAARRKLAALPEPALDEARIDAWLSYTEEEAVLLATTARKLRAGDKAGAERLAAKLTRTATQANNVALPFEFHWCLADPSQFT